MGFVECTVCFADLMAVDLDQSQSYWISHASNCKETSSCKSTTAAAAAATTTTTTTTTTTSRNCGRKNET